MTELQIQHCERCGTNAFPDRLWCPSCGSGELHHRPAGPGRVEEQTRLRRPPTADPDADQISDGTVDQISLGTVRLDAGPLVIARLAAPAGTGARVLLDQTSAGSIVAQTTPD